ncbi:hypothetical protein NDU88_011107 [Pleurodeles waltl]|uniref:Uncharacterized protein n=1 Tax=Pleurodeles waltl TaxID=8319 RepID=A0AAV7S4G1_PLEWA|nr:hypothetical protein NDU88_011107 [Pleurodeles waltl]
MLSYSIVPEITPAVLSGMAFKEAVHEVGPWLDRHSVVGPQRNPEKPETQGERSGEQSSSGSDPLSVFKRVLFFETLNPVEPVSCKVDISR